MIKKVLKFVFDKKYRFLVGSNLGLYKDIPDVTFLHKKFNFTIGKQIDFDAPETFNEKLQWLKLYDRRSEYTTMVDKFEVKKYIVEKIGEEYLIPTLGVWDDFDDIDFSLLPDKFVLKCTHDSGGLVVCNNRFTFDIKKAKKIINRSLKRNYYLTGREWPYKNVKPRIIAEQYMEDEKTSELRDYKFFCFNGEVKCFKIDFNRFISHRANYYDKSGNILHFGETVCPPDFNRIIEMPIQLELMVELAEKLSKGIPFLRVDFYEVNGRVYFGELTFFPASGFGRFEPEEWDYKLGEWLVLPDKKTTSN